MKNGKNPTKAQKIYLKEHRLNPDNWLITKNIPEEMLLVHRYTGSIRRILKQRKEYTE